MAAVVFFEVNFVFQTDMRTENVNRLCSLIIGVTCWVQILIIGVTCWVQIRFS